MIGPSPEHADWWYIFSWKGLLWSLVLAAVSAASVVIFTLLQFWSDGIRDRRAAERQSVLELQTEQARAAAAEANAEAARASEEAAQTNLVLERERKARLEIEARLAPRSMSPSQMDEMIAALQQFSGEAIFLKTNTLDPEAVSFANQLKATLERAGWAVQIWRAPDWTVDNGAGLLLEFFRGANNRSRSAGHALIAALTSLGLHVQTAEVEVGNPTAFLRLVIGRKN
ncbi:hypothetical protein ACO2I3_01920 [Leptospira interrogans]